jgi:hypothetical protein
LEAWSKRYAMIMRMSPNVAAARRSLAQYLSDLGLDAAA